jgi:hypothetical protein
MGEEPACDFLGRAGGGAAPAGGSPPGEADPLLSPARPPRAPHPNPLPAMRGEGASREADTPMRSSYSPVYGTRY